MKSKYKLLISIILIIIIIIGISLFLLYKEPKVAVLCYHNIGTEEEKKNFPEENEWTIDINNFEEQLKYLKNNGYKTLTLDEFYRWKKGDIELQFKSVLITFDDGFLSNYEYAFPLLKKYEINATVFLIGNYTKDKNEKWSGNLKEYIAKETIEKSKQEYPNIEFASHSYGLHENGVLQQKTYQELLDDGKQFNERIIDTQYYCYPFGLYNDNMINALKENKYKLAFTFGPEKDDYRKATRKDDDYLIPRLNVSYGMDIFKFGLRLILPF